MKNRTTKIKKSFSATERNSGHHAFKKRNIDEIGRKVKRIDREGRELPRKKADIIQMGMVFDSSEVCEFRNASGEFRGAAEERLKASILDQKRKEMAARRLIEEKRRKKEGIKLERELKKKRRKEMAQIFFSAVASKLSFNKVNSGKDGFYLRDLLFSSLNHHKKGSSYSFIFSLLLIFSFIGGVGFISKGLFIKGKVLGVSKSAYESVEGAIADVSRKDFVASEQKLMSAYENFSSSSAEIDEMGKFLIETSRFVPFASKLSSGKYMLEAAKNISAGGGSVNRIANSAFKAREDIGKNDNFSLLSFLGSNQKEISLANESFKQALFNIEKVNIKDLPEDVRSEFIILKERLPIIVELLEELDSNSDVLLDVLGGNGPRKYLFLFQNNHEMRATGGFIGSYGLLEVSNGRVRNFLIDGIFNPGGQLNDKIVPPKPIQKISDNWSLHDSNWFPDFPTSAHKIMDFYEMTGGATVDGVITFTPVVMQKLLDVTGPIEMEEYDVVLNSENFIEKTQYEVEVDYDKEENSPKKILSDLAPIVIDRIVNSNDTNIMIEAAEVFSQSLEEKHILIYSQNEKLQGKIEKLGWAGEILDAKKDYLSVVNSNINGFKTDGVVEEKIFHRAEIKEDGSIRVKLDILRSHKGGNTPYEWWNKVNANYMRVYVPLGSKLISASGYTREIVEEPIDYDSLGFRRDKLVESQYEKMQIDSQTGTRIYEENSKTVFANWTYVSPQEETLVTYEYELPFRLFDVGFKGEEEVDSYSLLIQKQSGSLGSEVFSKVSLPSNMRKVWTADENNFNSNQLELTSVLDTDKFVGIILKKN